MSRKTNCEYCDGTITTVKTILFFKSKALGTVRIPDIEQHKCSKCDNTSLSLDEANKVSQFVRDKEQHIIDNLPASDFISLNQAADLLGISKQAFSKHPRVKRGFIYSITIDNKKFFYKRSVEAFRDTKDGRVSLSWPSIINQIEVSVKPEPPREVSYSHLQQQILVNRASNFVYAQQKNNPLHIDTNADDLFIPATMYDQQSCYPRYTTTR
ncbi:MAG TPA: hypothetical protein HPP94_08040 [Desulfuromonadales bacterium]|nr:hypothetical protein [Desulfuromonadales bacterium]